jgi:hypothetical protein
MPAQAGIHALASRACQQSNSSGGFKDYPPSQSGLVREHISASTHALAWCVSYSINAHYASHPRRKTPAFRPGVCDSNQYVEFIDAVWT